jgi:predicted LPLAT superfamily acyltransferase
MSEREDARAIWLAREERGTLLGIRFVVWLCTFLGRSAARAFVYVLSLYYMMFATEGRRSSRAWLSHALGRPARLREVYRHLATFALVTLDRVFLLQGRRELFELSAHGTEHLDALTAQKQGALLLGAHIGSFEAMRARAGGRGHDIHVLAYFENAKKITQVLSALAPEMHARVILLGSIDAMIRAKDVVDGGAMVAMLGDRTGLNDKVTKVDFFGRPAPLPAGPFLLASALRCPVLLVFGIYRGGNRYDLHCEPFAERIVLPRGDRERALNDYAQRYAARLEHFAQLYPYNWCNIYDFWHPRGTIPPSAPR